MYLLKNTEPRYGWKSILPSLGLLLLLLTAGASFAVAQGVSAGAASQELTMTELLKLPGRVLAQGANTRGAGKYRVASYRVEEVALPHVTEVEIGGKKVQADKAYRVTLVGGPFPVRALPPVVWIDDVAVGYGVENEDLNEITAITYDASLLREGAALYLSYGDKQNKEDRAEVPERLKLTNVKGGN
jgi:hypothetical protein